ncbi:MAG: hypothetical protein EPN57_07105 [Paraburkholderia sp.]|nr:MAG: hypothetical protein EPN57_07105 [Paraburkholderia sp.]
MNYPCLPRASFGPLPSQRKRAIRLKFGERREHAEQLEDLLLPQRVDIDLIEGQSDPQGKLAGIRGERFEPLVVNFFKNKK